MRGRLFDDFFIEIDPGSMPLRGAWHRNPPLRTSDRGLLKFFYEKLKRIENPIVLDVGASTGSFCLLAAFHEMRVHAFEPHPEAYKFLVRNIKLNGLEDKITAHCCALSDVDGIMYLNVPIDRYAALSTLGKPRLFKKWRKIKTRVKRLDSLDLGHIDVMKIDTEGNEYNVLIGAERTIRNCKPGLLLEYRKDTMAQFGYEPQKIRDLLEAWGYRHFQLCGRRNLDLWTDVR